MILKKVFRFLLFALLAILFVVIVFIAVSVAPLNRDVDYQPLISEMSSRIESSTAKSSTSDTLGFQVGYASVSLVPAQRTPLAGYAKRRGKTFSNIQDTIQVRTLVIHNGVQRVAIVSADLLILPPTVTAILAEELSAVGFSLDNTYLGATHTHNSIGQWGEGVASFLYGQYSDSIVHFIADQIKKSILHASLNALPATLRHGAIRIPGAVRHRLNKGGPVDDFLRVIEVHRSDSSKLLWMSFTAHPTCIGTGDLALSQDYPGKLIAEMESAGYTFAMFMAGSVGSHRCDFNEGGEACTSFMTAKIATHFQEAHHQLKPMHHTDVMMQRVPLLLNDPQPKLTNTWRLRPWLFRAAFHEYPTHLTALRLGPVVLLGTPCDFSGDFNAALDSVGNQLGIYPMVTSFNGGYIGYVTPVKYADRDHFETRLMNWYGYGNGEYMERCMEKLLVNIGEQKK